MTTLASGSDRLHATAADATAADAIDSERAALARLYDVDLLEDPGDVDLYLALARRTAGPILELACGSGRLAIPLAAAGHAVTGVDLDPAMLDRARRAAGAAALAAGGGLHLVEADLVDLRLAEAGTYRLAFIGLNSLFLLASRDRQRAALETLARHLAPGGLAVVDVWQPDAEDLARFDGRVMLEYARTDPETGNLVVKTSSAQYDPTSQVVELTTRYEEGRAGEAPVRWLRTDRLRLISADELTGLAGDVGLQLETLAGTYNLEPIGSAGDRAILLAVRG
ncbi:MAG: class I SAM-dependent methyltransferase [Chloroflexota bacterium]